ncbi:hypothetical protein LXL04_028394 [Taraxacum kok-saghyz]
MTMVSDSGSSGRWQFLLVVVDGGAGDGCSCKRVGIPHSHPQIPPLSPSSQIPVGNYQQTETSHRSNSDIPFGFSTILQSSPPLIPSRGSKAMEVKRESNWDKNVGVTETKIGDRKSEGEVVDDFFSTYINLNNLGRLNSFRSETCEDLNSNTKPNGGDTSDNEATSSTNIHKLGPTLLIDKKEGRWSGGGASVVQCADGCRWCTDGGPTVVRRRSGGGPVVGAGGGPVK